MLFARLFSVGKLEEVSLAPSFSEVGEVGLKVAPGQRRVCSLCMSSCGIPCPPPVTPHCVFSLERGISYCEW